MDTRTRDILLIEKARDDRTGTINRNHLTRAFKRTGNAQLEINGGCLTVVFEGRRHYELYIGRGKIDLTGDKHPTFRTVLSELAQDVLEDMGIYATRQ